MHMMSEEDAVAQMLASAAAEKDEPLTTSALGLEEDDDEDEFEDETLAERLWGLTEMFPEPVRNVSSALASVSMFATKSLYSFGRNGIWIAASSAIILALPVLFEMERSQMEEQQLQQQRQILLGPNAASSGGMMPQMPQMVAPPTQR